MKRRQIPTAQGIPKVDLVDVGSDVASCCGHSCRTRAVPFCSLQDINNFIMLDCSMSKGNLQAGPAIIEIEIEIEIGKLLEIDYDHDFDFDHDSECP